MPYTKTNWSDRVVEKPLTYTLQNNPDGTVTLIPAEGTIVQAGTPITADVMNNLESQYAQVVTEAQMAKLTADNGHIIIGNAVDINDFIGQGQWYIGDAQGTINKPSGVTYGLLEVFKNGIEIFQRFTELGIVSNGRQFWRQYSGTTWTPWDLKLKILFEASATGGQVIPSKAWTTAVTSTVINNLGGGSFVNNKYTVNVDGIYMIQAFTDFAVANGFVVFSTLFINNTFSSLERIQQRQASGAYDGMLIGSIIRPLVKGDIIDLRVYQSDINAQTLTGCSWRVIKIGEWLA